MKEAEHIRCANMDVLRIVASFMVIMIHVAANKWHVTDVSSNEWVAMNFYDSAARSCVPIFFMLSGKLFLDREKMKPVSDMLKNNILKLAIIYVVWAALYAIDTIGVRGVFTMPNALGELTKLIIGAKYHLWFIPAMIGVYLLAPVMFSLKEYEKGKYVPYVLVMFFIFAILLTTIKIIPFQNEYTEIMLDKVQYELVGYSGYFLLGYYLSKKEYPKIRKLMLVALFAVIVVVSTIIGQAHAINIGEPAGILYGYGTLPVFLEAVLIFYCFLKIKIQVSAKTSKLITCISKCTLGIYLMHLFIIERLEIWLGINTTSFNTWFSIPIICVAVFVISTIVTLVLSKIPVINKWLI